MDDSIKTIIDELETAAEMEKTLQDYYKQAERASRNTATVAMLDTIEERHLSLAGRLKRRRDELERELGEGAFADALQAIGRAISDTVAGLPVGLIRTETDPSIEFLLESENRLLRHYEELRPVVDPETALLVEAAISSTQENLSTLSRIQGNR